MLKRFQLQLVGGFVIYFSVISQNRAISRKLNHYQQPKMFTVFFSFLSFFYMFFIIFIIIIYVYVFSTCTGLAEKRIRFPQGLSLVL